MATSALKFTIFAAVVLALISASISVPVTSETPTSSSNVPPPKAAATTPKSSVSDASLDAALADSRYLTRQLKCALGEAPCDPVGKRLKSLAPFVLRGACPKCTPGETKQIQKTLAHIQRTFPKEWARLVQTYAG